MYLYKVSVLFLEKRPDMLYNKAGIKSRESLTANPQYNDIEGIENER
jgi:hypothetical protein